MEAAAALAPKVLDEAAEWLLRLHSGTATEADHRALEHWRMRHPDHERAWQRAQGFLHKVREIPAPVGHQTLDRAAATARRRVLRQLALLVAAGPAVWAVTQAPRRGWTADYRTGTGERREIVLDDGSVLMLNTGTAVDVRFDSQARVLDLRQGELLVTTGRDAAQRPFRVETAFGTVRAIGTRFTVRTHADRSEVAVYEGEVELRPADAGDAVLRLAAGQRGRLTRQGAAPAGEAQVRDTMWVHGMLVVENRRLDELVAELDRHRPGRLRCDPAVAGLRISGAFPLTDIARSLELIEDVLPVKAEAPLRFWTVIGPRPAAG